MSFFLFGWLAGFVLFASYHPFVLSVLKDAWVTAYYLQHPGVQDFFENATFGGPEFTMTLLFPAVVMSLLFPWGRTFMSPRLGTLPPPAPFTTSILPPLLCLLGISSRWWYKTEQWCPPPPRTANSPAPKNFNQLPFFSFPSLLALDANPWTIENYPL